jgi:hypothetical protein
MRFYLNFPLVAGYVSMAITACLGMLQLAAARGSYTGLALFSAEREQGARIGAGLAVGAILAYVAFAPEILTPGPAGAEVAQMFALCALFALVTTLAGAAYRIESARQAEARMAPGESVTLGDSTATLYRPTPRPAGLGRAPVVVLLPDPTGFVIAPGSLVEALRQEGMAVLVPDIAGSDAFLSRRALMIHLSTILAQLARQEGIDAERIGLLGLGLGGDAVWQAAASAQVRAALAVSPVACMSSEPEIIGPGLHWLREMSYVQVWRWRRGWRKLRQVADDLAAVKLKQADLNVVVLRADGDILAMQKSPRDVERLVVPGRRRFTLLVEARVRKVVVEWFWEKLS